MVIISNEVLVLQQSIKNKKILRIGHFDVPSIAPNKKSPSSQIVIDGTGIDHIIITVGTSLNFLMRFQNFSKNKTLRSLCRKGIFTERDYTRADAVFTNEYGFRTVGTGNGISSLLDGVYIGGNDIR